MALLADKSADVNSNLVAGQNTQSLTFTMPGNVAMKVLSVVATIDNGAATAVTPELTIKDQSGVVIARKAQRSTIPAGDTGTATFALRLDDDGPASTAESYRDCVLANPHVVAFWPADEASGNLADLIGGNTMSPNTFGGYPTYGLDGPFTETAVEIQGSSGFTGNSPWFQASPTPYGSVFAGTHAWSIESWIYPTGYNTSGYQTTVFADGVSTGIRVALYGDSGYGANIEHLFVSRNVTCNSSMVIPLNTWTHWRATYDGSSLRLYINGVLDATVADASILTPTPSAWMSWGNWAETPTFNFTPWKGRLADLAIYDAAVTTFCPGVVV